VNLNEAGMIEPGAARFSGMDGLCAIPRITQLVTMPKLSRAEPLVAQVTYRYKDPGFLNTNTPAFGIGPGWQETLPLKFTNFATVRTCLGGANYAPESTTGLGAELEIALTPQRLTAGGTCNVDQSLDIDRFDIVVANPDECPAPGGAINGDLEANGGWVFTASGTGATATIEPTVGEGNTAGIRLFASNRCTTTTATNNISIPTAEDVPSPAISFFNKTSATSSTIETSPVLGGVVTPAISASGSAITQKVCVPASMRGGVVQFQSRVSISGTCAEIVNAESTLDNLKVINDASCGTDPAISDPGFESPLALIGANATPGKSLARALNDPTQAHTGNGVLQLTVMQLCDGASWQGNVVVPPPSGTAGPAITFFYKATPAANYTFRVTAAGGATFTPTLDNTYQQGTVCLNPKFVGRNQSVSFAMSGGSGTCATTHQPETAFVDDLVVTTDPNCPAI
jgi:hypothetical protein